MKIACDSCGAKYSIADEKVAGKVFKIRCKRCSEVIVVRGDQPGADGAAIASGADTIWHIVIDGEQAGPYSASQLAQMLSSGATDWEAYVWTEGFDNWLPMRDVPDLVAQITGAAQPAYAEPSYDAGDAFGAQPSMGADPFADAPGAAEPDLFGGRVDQASPFDGGHVMASSPSPRGAAAMAAAAVADQPAMTGARNENSVLFSLKNLQALATSPATPTVSSATHASMDRGGALPAGEGSGLIDIRALVTATGMADSDRGGAKDELLSMGNQGAFGALGSPMLAPGGDDDGGGKKMLIWAGVAGIGFLSAAVVAVAYIMRPPPSPSGTAVGTAPSAPVAAPAVAAPSAADEPGAEAPSEGELAAAKQAEDKGEASSERNGSSEHRRKRSSNGDSQGPGEPVAAEPQAATSNTAAKAPSKPGGPRTIDDLLDGALGSKGGGAKAAASAPKADLPDLPSREDVKSAMVGVTAPVRACAQGQSGVAMVKVSVAGSTGRVTSAEVTGITGPAGSCIAKAARGAQFPKFKQNVFKITYPFKL